MRNKKQKIHIHEINSENDIKFRQPLSYRHLRIFGWFFLIVSQIGALASLGASINNITGGWVTFFEVLHSASSLMSPLFLIAIFSVVLNAKDGYRRLFILYGGLTLLIYIVFFIVYQHYFIGLINTAVGYKEAKDTVDMVLLLVAPHGYLAFNIFIDLLLCTAVTFFFNYNPKHYFQGKKIFIFRLFAIIPILYEVASITLKILAGVGVISLTPYLYPLLTTKPPVAFLIFVATAMFIRRRQHFFLKKGKTEMDFKEFENTNTNKLHFSIFLSVTIVIAAIIDTLLLFFIPLISTGVSGIQDEELLQLYYLQSVSRVFTLGIGKTIPMLLIIPLIIFFDYKKTYPKGLTDLIIPAVGVGLVVIVSIEGGFLVARDYLADMIKDILKEDPEQVKDAIVRYLRR